MIIDAAMREPVSWSFDPPGPKAQDRSGIHEIVFVEKASCWNFLIVPLASPYHSYQGPKSRAKTSEVIGSRLRVSDARRRPRTDDYSKAGKGPTGQRSFSSLSRVCAAVGERTKCLKCQMVQACSSA